MVRWVAPGGTRVHVDFRLFTSDAAGPVVREFRFLCSRLTDYYFPGDKIRTFRSVAVLADHLILRDYREPTWDVYLSRSPDSMPDEFLRTVRHAADEYYNGWRTSRNTRLFAPGVLEEAFRNRFGLFYSNAPSVVNDLLLRYAAEHRVRLSSPKPRETLLSSDSRLLLLDRSYILGEELRVVKIERSADPA